MITNWFGNNKGVQNGRPNVKSSRYHIGDLVRNGRYGPGRVQGFRPDGAVIVRFDGRRKSQVIFPSLLER